MDANNYIILWSSNDSNVTSNEWCSIDHRTIFLGCHGGTVKEEEEEKHHFDMHGTLLLL